MTRSVSEHSENERHAHGHVAYGSPHKQEINELEHHERQKKANKRVF